MRRVALCAALAVAAGVAIAPAAAKAAVQAHACFHVHAPYHSYITHSGCRSGFVRVALRRGTAQVLTVTNWHRSSSYARFNGFSLTRGRWVHRWGPWKARIGADGFARPGKKIEGDELTPQGSYGFQFMFGVKADPGVHFRWRHAYRYDYWDDDPSSARYNLWTNIRDHHAGANPEPMHNVPVYNYAAVIGYNLARVPGKGSAIFLHVGDGQATAGCVSLRQSQILTIVRWLRPRLAPVITMRVL